MPPVARGQSKAQKERTRESSQHLPNRNTAPATATAAGQPHARSGTSTPETSNVQTPAATTPSSNFVPAEVTEYMHSKWQKYYDEALAQTKFPNANVTLLGTQSAGPGQPGFGGKSGSKGGNPWGTQNHIPTYESASRENVPFHSSGRNPSFRSPSPSFHPFRRPSRYESLTKTTIFQANPENPQPLINDLVQRIDYWRRNPGKQHKQELMRLLKKGKLVKQDGTPVPKTLKSPKETFDILADLYFEHAKTAEKLAPTPPVATPDFLPLSRGQRTPRIPDFKPSPPPNSSDVITYVNDIFYALRIVPSAELSTPELGRYVPPLLPNRSPYPKLKESGLIQPRPGAPLRGLPGRTPLRLVDVTSVHEFEQYIYSIAFHRKVSIKHGRAIMEALLDPNYQHFLSPTAFRYAITSLIDRASDLYSARRLGEIMTHRGFPLDIYIYNLFLMGALRVENLRMFANLLREILQHDGIQADSTTWNVALQMGIKIKSVNWVHSVLEVMKSRGIGLDHDALKATFMALAEVVPADVLKQYYFDYYSEYYAKHSIILWKPFHVVLRTVGRDQGIDEAWNLILRVSEKAIPLEASLSLFILICRQNNDYERAWQIIGKFRQRWHRKPVASGVARMFEWACELEEFSDAILLWKWAKLKHEKWAIERNMFLAARLFEREYGVAILGAEMDAETVHYNWTLATRVRRNRDPFHLVPACQRRHIQLMQARKHCELRRNEFGPTTKTEQLWMEIQRTYTAAVKARVSKPKRAPRIPPGYQPRASKAWKTIKPVSRLQSRENFETREMVRVWDMVQSGKLRIPRCNDTKEVQGIDEIPQTRRL